QPYERPLDDVQDLLHVVHSTESLARAFLNLPYRDANFLLARARCVGPIWCKTWGVPRADPAIPIPPELKALIKRGASVRVGRRDSGVGPERVRAGGPRVSRDRNTFSVCAAMAAGRKTLGTLRDNARVAVTFALPANSNAIQVWGRCIGTGRPHRDDLTAVQ